MTVSISSIGLDIDGSADVEPALLAVPGVLRIQRRRSAGGNRHYRLTLLQPIDHEAAFALRERLGDDPGRLVLDRARLKAGAEIDVLYDRRGNRRAGPWETLSEHMTLPK